MSATSTTVTAPDSADVYAGNLEKVWRFVRARIRDDHDAHDVTADVFVRAWRSWDRYDPTRGPVEPWLFTIGWRTITDRLRKGTPERPADLEAVIDDVLARGHDTIGDSDLHGMLVHLAAVHDTPTPDGLSDHVSDCVRCAIEDDLHGDGDDGDDGHGARSRHRSAEVDARWAPGTVGRGRRWAARVLRRVSGLHGAGCPDVCCGLWGSARPATGCTWADWPPCRSCCTSCGVAPAVTAPTVATGGHASARSSWPSAQAAGLQAVLASS